MSVKKFSLNLATMGLLVATTLTNVTAEQNGWFVGAQLGYGSVSARADYDKFAQQVMTDYIYTGTAVADSSWQGANSLRYGIMGGYKHFLSESFGLRFYGAFDYGTSEHKITGAKLSYDERGKFDDGGGNIQAPNDKAKFNIWKLNLNVDALYNFIVRENLDFGVFAGLSVGYTSGAKANAAYNESVAEYNESLPTANYAWLAYVYPYDDELKINGGFDFAINFGLRTNIAKHHGIELYSRFSFVKLKGKHTYEKLKNGELQYGFGNWTDYDSASTTIKVKQPYAVGLRYVFSF